MADHPAEVLPRLVRLSMEACDAGSAGVSVLDGDVFHWNSLVGKLSVLEGATTPRNFSPCGVCLDQSSPILMERPERAYSWIAEANITAPEILLVPLLRNGTIPLGTMIPMPTSSVISSGIEAVLDGGSRGTVKADEPPQAVSYAMPSRPRHA
jgi:hypothetical protein